MDGWSSFFCPSVDRPLQRFLCFRSHASSFLQTLSSAIDPLGCSVIQLLNFQAIQVLPVGPVASRSHSFEFNLELWDTDKGGRLSVIRPEVMTASVYRLKVRGEKIRCWWCWLMSTAQQWPEEQSAGVKKKVLSLPSNEIRQWIK